MPLQPGVHTGTCSALLTPALELCLPSPSRIKNTGCSLCRQVCSGHGSCRGSGTSGYCVCSPGFTGPACDSCQPGFQSVGGMCVYLPGAALGACSDGVAGGHEQGVDCGGVCAPCSLDAGVAPRSSTMVRLHWCGAQVLEKMSPRVELMRPTHDPQVFPLTSLPSGLLASQALIGAVAGVAGGVLVLSIAITAGARFMRQRHNLKGANLKAAGKPRMGTSGTHGFWWVFEFHVVDGKPHTKGGV